MQTRRAAKISAAAALAPSFSKPVADDDDTIMMNYKGELPFVVKRQDAYKDVIASVRSNLRALEVQHAKDDDIQITAFHPKYPDKLIQVTKEVWASFQVKLTEFTVAIRPPAPRVRETIDLLESDDEDVKKEETSANTVTSSNVTRGVAPSDVTSRKRKRTGKDGHGNNQPPKKPVHENTEEDSARTATSQSKGKNHFNVTDDKSRVQNASRVHSKNSTMSPITPSTDSADEEIPENSEYPSLSVHQDVEVEWIQENPHSHWLVPPRERIAAVRAYVKGNRTAVAELSQDEIDWLNGRQRHNRGRTSEKVIPALGGELYSAMMAAHEGHVTISRTWENLQQACIGPMWTFSYKWCQRCPTCWDQGER